MSCILTIIGKNLDVDHIITVIKIKPFKVSKRGQNISLKDVDSRKIEKSSVSFFTSKIKYDNFSKQVKDTIKFLKTNKSDIKKITLNLETEYSTIDFGIESTINKNTQMQNFYLPEELINIASDLKIAIQISVYSSEFEK